MSPQISKEKPKIYDRLVREFNINWDDGIIIAYHPNIYCKLDLPSQKIVHEAIHLERQKQMGVDFWWDLYISNKDFRLKEELLACKAEIEKIKEMDFDRNQRRFLFKEIYEVLSSKLYGNLITEKEAKEILS